MLSRMGGGIGSFGRRVRGVIVAAPTIVAPVLTRTSTAGTSPFTFDETLDATDYAGYMRRLQRATDSGFTAIVQDLYKPILEGEINGTDAQWLSTTDNPPRRVSDDVIEALVTTWTNTAYIRERIERDDGVMSAWSNTISDTLPNPLVLSAAAGDKSSHLALTNGNLTATTDDNTVLALVRTTQSRNNLKRQIEFTVGATPGEMSCGLEDGTTVFGPATASKPGNADTKGVLFQNGPWGYEIKYNSIVQFSDYASGTKAVAAGDVISFVYDCGPAAGSRTCAVYRTRSGSTVLLGTVTNLSHTTLYGFCGENSGTASNGSMTLNAGATGFARALVGGEVSFAS